MSQAVDSDLVLSGMSKASGGHYRQVRMEGVSKVYGDLACEQLQMNGVSTVQGSIHCGEAFEMSGKLSAEGGIEAPKIVVEGQGSFAGRMKAESVRVTGFIKVQGDCEAEQLSLEGGFTVTGLLTADELDIRLVGRGEAREIGGGRIAVIPSERSTWNKLFSLVIPKLEMRLTASTIEGDEIYLQATTAEVVRGRRVVIGPDCRIGRVEYEMELEVHPEAEVGSRHRR